MSDLPASSAEFIEKFAALARRLAAVGIAVHTADLHWGSFGHFTLMVMKGSEAVCFDYDGRDSFISVEASPVRQYSYPNQWSEVLKKGIENRQDEAIAFIENFLKERYSISA